MVKARELNYHKESESWAFLASALPHQNGAMMSMKDDARLAFDMPDGKTRRYSFKKGSMLVILKNGEVVYNSRDIIRSELQ